MRAVEDGDKEGMETEIADILILAFHTAHKEKIDPYFAVKKKLAICKKRRWGKPDANGVIEHIRD